MGHRYIGAKSRIIDFILNKIHDVTHPGAHVCDLMAGTATVSVALRDEGYTVTAVDVMTYSYHHARVGLLLNSEPSFRGTKLFSSANEPSGQVNLFRKTPYEKIIDSLNALEPQRGYFFQEFSHGGKPKSGNEPRNYFSQKNAMKIDAIRDAITQLREQKSITSIEYSLLLHDLILSTNDIANIAGTYGHFLAKLAGRAKDDFVLRGSVIKKRDDRRPHKALKGYAETLASKIRCDVCYIDPPYIKRQYAANYHVLETLARGDEPDAIGVSGLRPWRDQYSNFCTKTKVFDSFDSIITNMDCPVFLISYSEDGLIPIKLLMKYLERHGKVSIDEFKHKRFRSNDSALSSKLSEYLILLEKH